MYNQHQGNAPGSYQYVFSDFSNTHSTHIPKVENQFAVTHQQDFPYQLQQSILGDKLAIGSENIKIYVPDNYVSNKSLSPSRSHFKKLSFQGIQSRSDDTESQDTFTNHKREYTDITRTPAPVREPSEDEYEDQWWSVAVPKSIYFVKSAYCNKLVLLF